MMNTTMNFEELEIDELVNAAGGGVFKDEESVQRFLHAMVNRFMAEVLTLTNKNTEDPFYIMLANILAKDRIRYNDIVQIDIAIYKVPYNYSFFVKYIRLMKQESEPWG